MQEALLQEMTASLEGNIHVWSVDSWESQRSWMPTKAGGHSRVLASLWALSFYFCIYRLDFLLLSGLLGSFSAVTKKKIQKNQQLQTRTTFWCACG